MTSAAAATSSVALDAAELAAVRADFPLLRRRVRDDRPLVYLDSAATSQRPQCVIDAEMDFVQRHYGAVNRGAHQLAEEATEAFEAARAAVAAFVGVDAGEVVWTKNATEALNLVAYGIEHASAPGAPAASREALGLGPGDEVVITEAEHHANLVPWQQLCQRTGATLRWIGLDDEGRLDPGTFDVITPRTRVVAFTHASNVTGALSPVTDIVARAREVGAITVLDACQSVPHLAVNFRDLDVDFAAFSGHKMLGPTGIGVLVGRRDLLEVMPPVLTGGSMVEVVTMTETTFAAPPARFEAGTQMVSQAVGLHAAVDYLTELGMPALSAHEARLTRLLLEGVASVPGVRVLGPTTPADRVPTVAFAVADVHPHDVGQLLDAAGVAVRVGHHCAQPLHRRLGVPVSARASAGVYTNEEDIATFVAELAKVRPFFVGKS